MKVVTFAALISLYRHHLHQSRFTLNSGFLSTLVWWIKGKSPCWSISACSSADPVQAYSWPFCENPEFTLVAKLARVSCHAWASKSEMPIWHAACSICSVLSLGVSSLWSCALIGPEKKFSVLDLVRWLPMGACKLLWAGCECTA